MRFLILNQYFYPEIGAPQTRLAALVNELKSRGDDVEVVTAMPNHLLGFVDTEYQGKLYVKEVCDGVPVHRTWVYAARGTGVKRLLNYISFMLSCWLGLVRIEKPDYIFIESPPLFLALPGLIASRIYGTRTILNISDLWPDSVKELGVISNGPVIALATKFENWAYKRASVVNAVTEGILTRLAVAKGVPREKLLLLPNGVDTTLFSPRPKDVKLEQSLGLQGRRVVLYAGTHGIAQGLETLIEAAKLLWNSNITFLFVGDGSAKPALRDQAARLQLDNVMFVEPRPLIEMPGYYSLAFSSIVPLLNIKLFASARPSKLLPSLACGVPVIYCGTGETASFVRQHRVGLVADPGSPTELASAIDELSHYNAAWDEMSRNGREIALKDFRWSELIEKWLRDLSRVAAT